MSEYSLTCIILFPVAHLESQSDIELPRHQSILTKDICAIDCHDLHMISALGTSSSRHPRQDLLAASSEAVAKRDFRFDAGDHDMRGHGILCRAANALGPWGIFG